MLIYTFRSSVYQYTGQRYHGKALIIQMHIWACSGRRKQNKGRHRICELKLHLIDTFFCWHLWNWIFALFYLNLTWPWLWSAENCFTRPIGHSNRIPWPKLTRTHVSHDLFHMCDLKILVTFCDLALIFKCAMYRTSTLIVHSVCSWEYFSQNWVHSELTSDRQPACEVWTFSKCRYFLLWPDLWRHR